MTIERTSPAPPTTPPTVAHDSSTCRLGPGGRKCDMCWWAEHERRQARQVTEEPYETVLRLALEHADRSAAAIRARRTALLERADAHSPTEGAVALAEAYLDVSDWWQHLPNNALQDAAVLELAGRVEGVIGEYLEQQEGVV